MRAGLQVGTLDSSRLVHRRTLVKRVCNVPPPVLTPHKGAPKGFKAWMFPPHRIQVPSERKPAYARAVSSHSFFSSLVLFMLGPLAPVGLWVGFWNGSAKKGRIRTISFFFGATSESGRWVAEIRLSLPPLPSVVSLPFHPHYHATSLRVQALGPLMVYASEGERGARVS